MRPSDIGLLGILDELPVWEEYTIPLGLSIDRVKYYESLPQQSMRGLQALQYWRDGRCGPSYPGTWNFLFHVIDAYVGPNVGADLRKKVTTNKAWTYKSQKGVYISTFMVTSCVVHHHTILPAKGGNILSSKTVLKNTFPIMPSEVIN